MSTVLLKQLEQAVKRQHRGGKKKKAKRKTAKRRRAKRAPKVVVRTRTRVVHVHHRPKAKAHRAKPRAKRKATKKRKGGKLSKTEFLRRMALGRARAKRARKH
jgi:hypothetical protein